MRAMRVRGSFAVNLAGRRDLDLWRRCAERGIVEVSSDIVLYQEPS